MRSVEAQAIVRGSGFIDQELEGHFDGQLRRMTEVEPVLKQKGGTAEPFVTLARDLRETSRISTTMRFRPNSVELENKALRDVGVLAQFLRFIRDAKVGRKLVLVGFTDGVGAIDKNIALSLERANAVRQALLRKLADPQYAKLIEVRGYGPELAVACNENEAGRDKNRRVEVWLR
jgi:phosphate transport system substrate-binding protein